jgi:hypothetical protein
MKQFAFASLLFVLTSPALAGEVLIPVVYRGGGVNDTQWRTDITIANVTTHPQQALPVPVTITLHRDNGENLEISMPLARMEVVSVRDAVYQWWSVESGGGIVRVTWDETDARIAANARIYTTGEHGEYGQSVPGVDTWTLVSEHFLPGLSGVDGNRTNVGVSNPSAASTLVWIELFDTAGTSRGAFATAVGPRSFRQFNDIFSYFQAGPLNAAMVRVSGVSASVYAYASIVRNDSGDATFVRQP